MYDLLVVGRDGKKIFLTLQIILHAKLFASRGEFCNSPVLIGRQLTVGSGAVPCCPLNQPGSSGAKAGWIGIAGKSCSCLERGWCI